MIFFTPPEGAGRKRKRKIIGSLPCTDLNGGMASTEPHTKVAGLGGFKIPVSPVKALDEEPKIMPLNEQKFREVQDADRDDDARSEE